MPSASGTRPSDRPRAPHEAAPRHNATRPGWAIPTAPQEVPNTETALARLSPPPLRDDELIEPHSAPPSWRMGSSLVEGAGHEIVALRDQGLRKYSIPVTSIAVIVVAAFVIGVLAAVVPAWRATKQDILRSIAIDG